MSGERERAGDIEQLIRTAMESLREMVDVNTIIGDIIESESGVSIIPVSRVCCGFLAGGGELTARRDQPPFVGGSGAGLQVQPVGFLVVQGEQIRLLPVCDATPLDRAVEAVPVVAREIQRIVETVCPPTTGGDKN